jgi:hypothetical protein
VRFVHTESIFPKSRSFRFAVSNYFTRNSCFGMAWTGINFGFGLFPTRKFLIPTQFFDKPKMERRCHVFYPLLYSSKITSGRLKFVCRLNRRLPGDIRMNRRGVADFDIGFHDFIVVDWFYYHAESARANSRPR